MDLETDVKNLLEEETYINKLLNDLNWLIGRKGYGYLSKDVVKLMDELAEKKENVKKALDDISNEMASVAEAFAEIDFCTLDANLR